MRLAANRRAQLAAKRAIDLIGAGVLLLSLSPVLLAAAATVRLTSPGPALFRQERLGRDGQPFTMLKFRTMGVEPSAGVDRGDNAAIYDHERALLHKRVDDPRVTRFGRLLRRSSVDELPQLFNVLRGDMSLVGPRPLFTFMLAPYPQLSAERQQMRPGMTGLWQVSERSSCQSALAMADADLRYVRRFNLLLDARIVAATIPACLRGEGAF